MPWTPSLQLELQHQRNRLGAAAGRSDSLHAPRSRVDPASAAAASPSEGALSTAPRPTIAKTGGGSSDMAVPLTKLVLPSCGRFGDVRSSIQAPGLCDLRLQARKKF